VAIYQGKEHKPVTHHTYDNTTQGEQKCMVPESTCSDVRALPSFTSSMFIDSSCECVFVEDGIRLDVSETFSLALTNTSFDVQPWSEASADGKCVPKLAPADVSWLELEDTCTLMHANEMKFRSTRCVVV
jgi:hypothetical protein